MAWQYSVKRLDYLLLALVATAALACKDEAASDARDLGARVDQAASTGDLGLFVDGGGQTSAAFSIIGCQSFTVTDIGPLCIGPPPLDLTFVALLQGTSSYVWTLTGGDPSSSSQVSPSARYDQPGTYLVRLAAQGPGGTSVYTGTIVVTPGSVASPCRNDADCDASAGLSCLCQGGTCPGGLSVGFCTKDCELSGCGTEERCVDLDRVKTPKPSADGGSGGGSGGDGGVLASEAWRRRICLPACTGDAECRPGLSCLQLPTRPAGTYLRACFAAVAGEVGAPCTDGNGAPDASRCFSGRCLGIGAFGQCTDDCMNVACPLGSDCASVAGQSAVCVARCGAQQSCADPLLSCQTSSDAGAEGLHSSGSEPLCAPRPCDDDLVCGPLGVCSAGYCSR